MDMRDFMLKSSIKYCLFCLFFLIPFQTFAFKFSPMSASIRLDQKENRIIFNLENESLSPVAIELSLKKRVMKLDGSEDHLPLPDDSGLSVYPEQLIIPPGQRRSVRVSFAGKAPSTELAYRLIAEQLPIQLEEPDRPASGIRMLMRYIAAIYIDPGKTQSDVHPLSFRKEKNDLIIVLENKGNKHQLLQNVEISFVKSGSPTLDLKDDELIGILGENILANSTREFKLSQFKQLNQLDQDYQIHFRLKP
jgi:fimbrial chaperone protein